jgi:hypothetical protein
MLQDLLDVTWFSIHKKSDNADKGWDASRDLCRTLQADEARTRRIENQAYSVTTSFNSSFGVLYTGNPTDFDSGSQLNTFCLIFSKVIILSLLAIIRLAFYKENSSA